ncbi:MAG: ATP-dependent Clp protease proteolytic subunit [Planctomycetes bacterium]|nr:ATP-dependent Clp protease proteolytic subunit [Planctomycetota bacterium]
MATKETASSSRTLMNRLLEHRIVMLSEPVMPKPAQRLMAQLLLLDAQDSKKPIHFYINTPGGSISDGFAIFDTVRFLRAPVITVCTGLSASMGTILMLSPPEKKNRVCLPNTRFMIHQPSSAYRGSAADIEIGAKEIRKLRDRLIEIYVQETKMNEDRIRADLNRDYWMTSEEAVKYGLCDRVVRHVSDLG